MYLYYAMKNQLSYFFADNPNPPTTRDNKVVVNEFTNPDTHEFPIAPDPVPRSFNSSFPSSSYRKDGNQLKCVRRLMKKRMSIIHEDEGAQEEKQSYHFHFMKESISGGPSTFVIFYS